MRSSMKSPILVHLSLQSCGGKLKQADDSEFQWQDVSWSLEESTHHLWRLKKRPGKKNDDNGLYKLRWVGLSSLPQVFSFLLGRRKNLATLHQVFLYLLAVFIEHMKLYYSTVYTIDLYCCYCSNGQLLYYCNSILLHFTFARMQILMRLCDVRTSSHLPGIIFLDSCLGTKHIGSSKTNPMNERKPKAQSKQKRQQKLEKTRPKKPKTNDETKQLQNFRKPKRCTKRVRAFDLVVRLPIHQFFFSRVLQGGRLGNSLIEKTSMPMLILLWYVDIFVNLLIDSFAHSLIHSFLHPFGVFISVPWHQGCMLEKVPSKRKSSWRS